MLVFYETDAMGVVHHSNYIRWFEEARVDLMDKMGFGYDRCEKEGIIIPVLEVNCKYLSSVKFGQSVKITTRISRITPVRLNLEYEVEDIETGKTKATGKSRHCFTNSNLRPVALYTLNKELYDLLKSLYAEKD